LLLLILGTAAAATAKQCLLLQPCLLMLSLEMTDG
jgi:hypothetical protein